MPKRSKQPEEQEPRETATTQEPGESGPKQARHEPEASTEPYSWKSPKEYLPDEFNAIVESLGGTTQLSLDGLSATVDHLSKRATFKVGDKEGFNNVLHVGGMHVSIYAPSGQGQFPNLDQIRCVVQADTKIVSGFREAVVNALKATAGDLIKTFPNGPDKVSFKNNPAEWINGAIQSGQVLLPAKSTDVYGEDGSIERQRTEIALKTRITSNSKRVLSEEERQEQYDLALKLFGPEVADNVRDKHTDGKTLRLPQFVDAMGIPIPPEEIFSGGNFRFSGIVHGAFASLFLMEQKSKTHANFSSITTMNKVTVIRRHASTLAGEEAMTDAQRVTLSKLL